MYDLPWATHRYLIEPLSGLPHIRKILGKRFLSFISMVRSSSKYALVQLLEAVVGDARCTTGSNLRNIMLMAGKNRIEELDEGDIDIEYHEILESEAWRVDFIKEVVELKYGDLSLPGFTEEELEEIQNYLCTQ